MIEEINNAKYWFFGRINKIEDPKRTVDFLLLVVFPAECACMDWLTQVLGSHGITGGSRGEHETASTAPLFQTRIHRSLLDPADTLHLEGLGMRAPLPEMLVVAQVVITL